MERAVYQQTPQALPIEDYLVQAVYGPYAARQAALHAAVPPPAEVDEAEDGEEETDASQ